MNKIKYITASLILDKDSTDIEESVLLPDGVVTHFAIVQSGNDNQEIINLSFLENNTELLKPSDLRFSEKTANGNFLESMRPVSDIDGGRKIQVRLAALKSARPSNVNVQVLFAIQTNPFNL